MNRTESYQLTIIVPVYNEEDNIQALAQALGTYLSHAAAPACVLFVNDGSRDRSAERIREACAANPHFFYLDFARNCGLSAAIKAGFDAARSPYVGYMDADLQTTPEDFDLLLAQMPDHEMAVGIRARRKDTLFKRLQSKIANGFRRMMTGDGIADTGCPLKILRTDYAQRVPMFTGMHRFLPALVLLQEGRIAQVPVRHFPRTAGESKFHLWNRLRGPFVDCFAYRWMRKRYINYQVKDRNYEG